MKTRFRLRLRDDLLYELQHLAVDEARARGVRILPVNKLLEEAVETLLITRRGRSAQAGATGAE